MDVGDVVGEVMSFYEIKDVGVNSKPLCVGLFTGLSIFAVAGLFEEWLPLFFISGGCLLALKAIADYRKMYSNTICQEIDCCIDDVFIERFRLPGYAGERFRYRIAARYRFDQKFNLSKVFLFDGDNVFESLQEATSLLDAITARSKCFKLDDGCIYLSSFVRENKNSELAANIVGGGVLIFVGVGLYWLKSNS